MHQVVYPGHVVLLSICHTSSGMSRPCHSLVYMVNHYTFFMSCFKLDVQAILFTSTYVISCVICPGHVVLSSICQVVCPGHVVLLFLCHASSGISRPCRSLVYMSYIMWYVQAMSFSRLCVIHQVVCQGHVVLLYICHTSSSM